MKYALAFGFILLSVTFYAQESRSVTFAEDSIDNAFQNLQKQLQSYERLLRKNDQIRKQDSLARMDLLKQIQLLKENDLVTQSRLKNELKEIEIRDSMRRVEQVRKIEGLKSNSQAYAVNPFKDTLYFISTKLGTIQPEERAANVKEKIEILVEGDDFDRDSLRVEEHDGTMDIMYGRMIVASVSDWDALWAQDDKSKMANEYAEKIVEYIASNRARSSTKNIFARIGLVFLIIGGAFLVIFIVNRLISGLKGWMVQNRTKYFTGIKLGTYEVLPPKRQLDVSVQSANVLKWVLYALTFYLSLPIIFGLFPFTRGWAKTLLDWILKPINEIFYSFWNYLPNFFTIAVIYIVIRYIVKVLRFIAKEIELGHLQINGFHTDWALPTFRLVKFLVYAFMFVVIFPYLPGSDSDVFKGVSIFLGLLISLGSTSAISNAVAGLVITYMRPYQLGDRVRMGEITGEIIEKTILVTRIRTSKNEDITVPNAAVLTGHTINYSTSSQQLGLILHTSVTIGYDVPWRKVHQLLIAAAVATDGVNVTKEPFVLQTSLDDFYVSYQLNAYTEVPELVPRIYSALHANIQDKFNEAGVEIMSPHYRANRDGNLSTIPK